MDTFTLIERRIGRRLKDCIDVKQGPETLRVPISWLGREVEVWVPPFDLFENIAIDVANAYRGPQTFDFGENTLWPYIDSYQPLHLSSLAGPDRQAALLECDKRYLGRIVDAEIETVYARAREALIFSDGVQVMDPFMPLVGRAIDAASMEEFGAHSDATLPPATLIREKLRKGDRAWQDDYRIVWAACLQEAVDLEILVKKGCVRLTPGRHLGVWKLKRLLADETTHDALLEGIIQQFQVLGSPPSIETIQSVLRTTQTLIDTSAFKGSSPFFFSSDHLRQAQAMVTRSFEKIADINGFQMREANLPTLHGFSVKRVSDDDLIALRQDSDVFQTWRDMRTQMTDIADKTPREVREMRSRLTAKWRRTLEKEKQSNSVVARNLRTEGLLFGVIGAAGAAGVAMASPASMFAIILAGAIGGLTSAAKPVKDSFETRRKRQIRSKAHDALACHLSLLALDKTSQN